jgi:hypothetical protein
VHVLTKLQEVSSAAMHHVANEDRVGSTTTHAWAIDGATPLSGVPCLYPPSDAAWLAELTHSALESRGDVPLDPPLGIALLNDVASLCGARISEVGPSDKYVPPIAALAMCMIHGDHISILQLSDVSVLLVNPHDFVTLLSDQAPVRREAILADAAGHDGLASLEIQGLLRDRRLKELNRPGGSYWALSTTPIPKGSFRIHTVPVHDVRAVLLATDGFMRAITHYEIFASPDSLTHELLTGHTTLNSIVARIRQIEDTDRARTRFPRLTAADDASAILLQVG